MKMLVIGYGNELRQDDGVGPRVARAVAGWQRPGLEGVAVHQLTPELAVTVSQADRVVFVDAKTIDSTRSNQTGRHALSLRSAWDACDGMPRPSKTQGVSPHTPTWGHTCDPQDLLALAEVLNGRRPEAWLMEVPAACLGFGEELSPLAKRGMEMAIDQIRKLVEMEQD